MESLFSSLSQRPSCLAHTFSLSLSLPFEIYKDKHRSSLSKQPNLILLTGYERLKTRDSIRFHLRSHIASCDYVFVLLPLPLRSCSSKQHSYLVLLATATALYSRLIQCLPVTASTLLLTSQSVCP